MSHPVLTNTAARRLFLDRHALAEAPVGPAVGADLAALIDRIGFVQIDSINTVERAHHMILWSRRQSYKPDALKRLHERDRGVFEHWTHDASILPVHLHGHWQHKFQRREEKMRQNWANWFRPGYEPQFETILARIAEEGPLTTSDVGEGEVRGSGGWWDWNPSKTALEWLWHTGKLAIARRDGFQKVYDLTERVIPDHHLSFAPDEDAMIDWSCNAALDRLGFADPSELRSYWALITVAEAKAWTTAAVKRGDVIEVGVTGADGRVKRSLARPDVVEAAARAPEPVGRLRILSPFDPALRDRDRALFLFGFHYRIEVFVPEAKRKYGYYVFPVLEGDRLVGRLDAKAHRDAGALRVKGFWPEAGVKLGSGRQARLEAELDRLARFAGCDRVEFLDGWLRETLAGAAG